MSEIFWQSDSNFWKIVNGKIDTLEYGTKTIAETSKYTPFGSYTSFRTYNDFGVLRLSKHLDRLVETARLAGHEINLDKERLVGYLVCMIATAPGGDKRFRITIDLEKHIGDIYIAWEPLKIPAPEKYGNGAVCMTAEAHRDNPKAKLSNFLSRAETIKKQETKEFDEIIMYGEDEKLLEGLSSNFYAVKGGTVYTADEGVLSGTTRDFILHIANELQIPVDFTPVSVNEISELDEAFISSTSRSILPIRSIDGIVMNKTVPGPITEKLMKKFSEELNAALESVLDYV